MSNSKEERVSRAPRLRVVVFGATGLIGSAVVADLLTHGFDVVAVSRTGKMSPIAVPTRSSLTQTAADIQNTAELFKAVEGADWVFHLASSAVPASAQSDMAWDVGANLLPAIRLLEASVANHIKKVVFASSGGTVYGFTRQWPIVEDSPTEPLASYGVTKLAAEKYCGLFRQHYGLNVRCLRIANAFGPGHTKTTQGIIPNLLKAALTQQPLPVWGDGSVVRDYVYVKDVARAFRMAAAYDGDEMVFNIATGRGHSVLEVADVVRTTTGLPLNLMLEPARPIDVPINILAIARARRELDWYPLFSLERGIAETWRSMERQIS